MGYLVITGETGQVGITLGANAFMVTLPPIPSTIVYESFDVSVDDAGFTVDTLIGAGAVISAVACATAATPGTWVSKHFGGTQDPVNVAASGVLSLTANAAAADTRLRFLIVLLI